jgi:predicted nucleic acid-binding Zn ribbon protein
VYCIQYSIKSAISLPQECSCQREVERKLKIRARDGKGSSKLIPVQDVLKTVFSRLEMPEDLELKGRVFLAWEEAVGNASRHSNPFRFRGSTLIVEVTSSAWLTELSMRKTDIIKRLERAVGEKVVKDIRFQIKRKQRED